MEQTGSNTFTKRIGTTVYQVNVFFDENAEKSFEEKNRLIIQQILFKGIL